jgi:hypothetical protein
LHVRLPASSSPNLGAQAFQLPGAIFVRVIGLEHIAEILVFAGIAHLDMVRVPA